MKGRTRINNQIRATEVRVLSEDGESLGVMSVGDAQKKADDQGLDLVEVTARANPPVVKIINYGKYEYLEKKKRKEIKAKGGQITETKNLQIKIGTGQHDLERKAGKASEFLKQGHRVRLELFLRGRVKGMDKDFLKKRLERILQFISEDYKIAEELRKSPRGISIVVEKAKGIKKEDENK